MFRLEGQVFVVGDIAELAYLLNKFQDIMKSKVDERNAVQHMALQFLGHTECNVWSTAIFPPIYFLNCRTHYELPCIRHQRVGTQWVLVWCSNRISGQLNIAATGFCKESALL